MKLKLSTRKDYCRSVADRIHKTNPILIQIEKAILDVYETAYDRGYEDAILDNKKLKDSREALLKRDFNRLRDLIDDKIHQIK
jgi:hypothetical protein